MGEALRQRLKMTRFETSAQQATLGLLVAAAHLRELFDKAYEPHGITLGQFNVLRILRGAQPQGFPRYEIAQRMVDRAPDLTRMIDRLVDRGLVERTRSARDRRHSVARITRKGLELLAEMQPTLDAVERGVAARLNKREALELSRLCERIFAPK